MRVATDAARSLRLRQQIATLAEGFCDRPSELADAVMLLVDAYEGTSVPSGPALLSPHGAVLCELARSPGSTLREMSVRLGLSEGYVQKLLTQVVTCGFASRTRVGQRVVYKIARDEVLRQADSRRFALLLADLAAQVDVEVLDSTV